LVAEQHCSSAACRWRLTARRASCGRVWEGEFSSEAHMERQLHMLNDFVFDQNDWVIAADSDELQEWPKPIK
jgi:hypothetical protein